MREPFKINNMSQSTSTDINYLSCAENKWERFSGSAAPEVAEAPKGDDAILCVVDPRGYASILKICDHSIVKLNNLYVDQGRECSVDINNNAHAVLSGVFGQSWNEHGDQVFSVKGNSMAFINGVLRGQGHRLSADVLVDNWSDQDYRGSIVNLENASHITGRKIKVVKRFFASKVLLGKNARILWFNSALLTAYWWAKWTVRKVLGIKQGQRGPSWI